ncbi:MAG: hypothetical protein ACD_30C00087G0014 [uncultured bacterium]|nr:MAG: hypothetical protein ACD_30C00087G0014 [uncultured bacterium]
MRAKASKIVGSPIPNLEVPSGTLTKCFASIPDDFSSKLVRADILFSTVPSPENLAIFKRESKISLIDWSLLFLLPARSAATLPKSPTLPYILVISSKGFP